MSQNASGLLRTRENLFGKLQTRTFNDVVLRAPAARHPAIVFLLGWAVVFIGMAWVWADEPGGTGQEPELQVNSIRAPGHPGPKKTIKGTTPLQGGQA